MNNQKVSYNAQPTIRKSASEAQRASILARHLDRANARKRRVGENRITILSQGADVLRSNFRKFEITEANKDSITIRASKGGKRASQSGAKHKGDPVSPERRRLAESYRTAAHALAVRISEKHVRQARMRCDHLIGDLRIEIESVIGEFFAVRLARFPILASDVLARFAVGALPSSTVRALHRVARRACDQRMARMGGKSQLVDPSFFNLFADDSADRSSELDTVFVNARIDYLIGLVRAKAGTSGNAKRGSLAHVSLLESARAYFIASINGDRVSLPSAGLVPVQVPVGFNTCQTFAGKKLIETKGEIVKETRGSRLANSALYMRLLRLARFAGAPDVVGALARQARA
jgi:hypothetical protein